MLTLDNNYKSYKGVDNYLNKPLLRGLVVFLYLLFILSLFS